MRYECTECEWTGSDNDVHYQRKPPRTAEMPICPECRGPVEEIEEVVKQGFFNGCQTPAYGNEKTVGQIFIEKFRSTGISYFEAKNCAIIAVYILIKEHELVDHVMWNLIRQEYWEQIKNELEKL